MLYLKPACFIRNTSSQNWKYKLDCGHWVVGKCAIGKRNLESLKKMNWSTVIIRINARALIIFFALFFEGGVYSRAVFIAKF